MAFGNIYRQGISRLLCQQNGDGARRVSFSCFFIALATGVVLAVLMTVFNRPLLTLLGTGADTVPLAFWYYIVLVGCVPIMVFSFIHSSLVRCESMSIKSMIGAVLSVVINIILAPNFISVVNIDSIGTTVATVIGYFCSVLSPVLTAVLCRLALPSHGCFCEERRYDCRRS